MSARLLSDSHLYRTGSLKWTGITTASGESTISAWVAKMDLGTVSEVAEAMKGMIDDGLLSYQPTWLEPRIVGMTAEFQKRRFGWDVDVSHVCLMVSVLPVFEAIIQHLVRPDLPIIVPMPAYIPFLAIPGKFDHPTIKILSLRGTRIGGRDWALDPKGIRAGLKAGAGPVILCNPWNPVGRVLREDEFRALHDVVSGYDAFVFFDEIHSSPVLGEQIPLISYASLSPSFVSYTVTVITASEGRDVAGLLSAQAILPDEVLRERWDVFTVDVRHGANVIGTVGAIAAYERGDARQREVKDLVRSNVDLVERALVDTLIDFVCPEGAYLVWWGFEGVDLGPLSPAATLRERARTAANEGRTLRADYASWVCINLACTPDAASRIVERVLGLL